MTKATIHQTLINYYQGSKKVLAVGFPRLFIKIQECTKEWDKKDNQQPIKWYKVFFKIPIAKVNKCQYT